MTTQPSLSDTCPVCLRKLKRCDILAQPESCGHQFCYICISEWAKNVNTCPVDRIKFNTINISYKDGSKSKVYVPDADPATKNDDDVTFCEVCHECTREDSLLLCDGCDKGYHLDCLEPPLYEIPEGNWYCPTCQPIVADQVDMASSSQDEFSMNVASDTEVQNDSAVSGTERKPILIDDEDSDGADDGDRDGDDTDDSLSDFIDDGLESVEVPRHTSRSRRIKDDDENNDGGGDSDLLSSRQVPVLSSPLRLSPELSSLDEADGTNRGSRVNSGDDEVLDSDCSSHSGIHVQPNARSRSGWRLVLSTSSSNNSTPRKDTPTRTPSDSLFMPSAEKTTALRSFSSTLSPVSGSLIAPAATSLDLLCNGGEINNTGTCREAVDPFLSPFETVLSGTVQHKQKCGRSEPTQNGRRIVQPVTPPTTRVCEDPLTSISTRSRKPAASCSGAREPQRKTAKKRRKVRRLGTRKKEGKRLKKRKQALQFVTHLSSYRSDEDDPSYVPDPQKARSLLTPQGKVRTRARTAATHSPCGRNPAFTAAVLEAQRCPDSSDGLIKARAVLNGERRGAAAHSSRGGRDSSPSRVGGSSNSSGTTHSVRSEIARRMVPKRRLIQIAANVSSQSPISPPASRSASLPRTSATQELDLVGTICQKLDDLQSKHNVIRRDGTIIPIRSLDTSRPRPMQEEKGDRVTLFSEPDFSPDPSPLVERNVAKSPEIRDDILVCCSSTTHTFSSSDVINRTASSDLKKSKSTLQRAFSALKKSASGSMSLSRSEIIPNGMEHSSDSSAIAVDCLDSQTNSAFMQARTELSFKHSCREADLLSPVSSEELVKQCLNTHYINRTITEREYHRIVERATKKVQAGSRFDVARIRKLVEDYVVGYIRQRDVLTS